ncbi:hypothetical protein [Micromonospora viridifaciens]|uniref:hypothetical protein n=1 Tax=Micromonospora viridifaciens TaxID=1881 RepID=UPI0012FE057C|nr:hypothetical protein [Micromonospora viridifaciens]
MEIFPGNGGNIRQRMIFDGGNRAAGRPVGPLAFTGSGLQLPADRESSGMLLP